MYVQLFIIISAVVTQHIKSDASLQLATIGYIFFFNILLTVHLNIFIS